MRSPRFTCSASLVVFLICVLAVAGTSVPRAQVPAGNFGVGIPEVFLPRYLDFRSRQLASGAPNVMRVDLGYVKGLSRSFITMTGEATLDLSTGSFSVSLEGLTPLETYSVWLVDRTQGLLPLPDTVLGLATLLASGPTALVTGLLPVVLPLGFNVDRIAVVEGLSWNADPLAAGTVNVFQRAFFRRVTLVDDSTGAVLFNETGSAPLFSGLVPPLEFEIPWGFLGLKRAVKLDRLISRGAELFFEETFEGNGRTCGTCHPASNNFTIDPDFIATRPANDPLFVAEFNANLAGLERPALMRSFGLILENLDGLSDPTNLFVMRSVPHTLGMPVSLEQDTNLPDPPAEMTGWSGDGAPGTGSLREFAIGAVIQHFPQDLERVENRDFRLPTERELDAMEAFQLSLGRENDVNLAALSFNDGAVDQGRLLFLNGTGDPNAGGRCAACHGNGGALNADLLNRNFNTNVEDVVHPARLVEGFPIDGGFGRLDNGDGTFGDRTFNTASVVEAADTPPFFHNNLVDTLEAVVDFYTGPEFNLPRAPAARFSFTQAQRDKVADFMRALNTLQNIDVAKRELQAILDHKQNPSGEQDRRLQTAFDDTQDGIDVLTEGAIFPGAVSKLTDARNLISQAQASGSASQRRALAQQAIGKLGQARSQVVS